MSGAREKRPRETDDGAEGARRGKGRSKGGGGQASGQIPKAACGFLVSCEGGKETRAALEVINVVTEHHAALARQAGSGAAEGGASDAGKLDIAAEIKAEFDGMQDRQKKLFWYILTGLRGLVFVEMNKEAASGAATPTAIMLSIAEELARTKVLRTRYALRVTPVETTCYAGVQQILEAATPMVQREFPSSGEGFTMAVELNSSAADKALRGPVIDGLARLVPTPPHSVSLSDARKVILVTLIRNSALLAVFPRYYDLKKLNWRRLAGVEEGNTGKEKGREASGKDGAGEKGGGGDGGQGSADKGSKGPEADTETGAAAEAAQE